MVQGKPHGAGGIMSIEHTIYCDNCSALIDASEKSATHARKRAIEQGVMVRRGKKDLCLSCAEETAVTQEAT